MNDFQRELLQDQNRRIWEKETELRALSDDELMRFHERALEVQGEPGKSLWWEATDNEVRRRLSAAARPWRGLFNREGYRKWERHLYHMKALSLQSFIDEYSNRDDPQSRQIVLGARRELEKLREAGKEAKP